MKDLIFTDEICKDLAGLKATYTVLYRVYKGKYIGDKPKRNKHQTFTGIDGLRDAIEFICNRAKNADIRKWNDRTFAEFDYKGNFVNLWVIE